MLKKCAILLLMLAVNLSLMAQERKVSGAVNDSGNEPIPGVSVLVKGTTNGTITDINGQYSLAVPGDNTVLVFSFIGMKTQELTVGPQSTINITMASDLEQLDEVVVVGYGVQKKKLVTGATSQVKGDELQKRDATNALQALQGQAAGIQISSTSGQPGEGMKVIVRGVGTINNSNPLYIVDGVPTGDITYLNNSDIQTIDVLKDAAAAAIYGSRAANGVVLITTKGGQTGKAQVTFDAYRGVQNVGKTVELLNSQEYATIKNEQSVNQGGLPIYDLDFVNNIPSMVEDGTMADTKWLDEMFIDNAVTQNYSLGINGGNDMSVYSISSAYTQQEGIVGGGDLSNYERYTFKVNSDHKLYNNFLKVGQHLSMAYINRDGIQVGNQYSNALRSAFTTNPFMPMYDANGDYFNSNEDPYAGTNTQANPYASMVYGNQNERNYQKVLGDLHAEIAPVKGLTIRTKLGFELNSEEYRGYTPIYELSVYSFNDREKVSQSMSKGYKWIWENYATYNLEVNDHKMDFTVGTSAERATGTNVNGSNVDPFISGLDNAYLSNTTNKDGAFMGIGGGTWEDMLNSYFGRVSYNYKEKYLLNATFRADGSSKFAAENRWGYFPSVSAGWNISNEEFMEGTKGWLDYLKLRGSWGQNGNQNVDAYKYLSPVTYAFTNYSFGNAEGALTPGAYANELANPNLKWETSEQINVGFDSYMLSNRLSVNVDWYKKTTKDWLIRANVASTAGVDSKWINGGNVENSGVELALGWNDKIGGFSYSLNANAAKNTNKVTEIPTVDGIIHGSENVIWANSPEFYRAESGMPMGYFWGYKTLGVFQNPQQVLDYTNEAGGLIQPSAMPGDLIYKDVNNDGAIDSKDKSMIGNPNPDVIFGFTASCTYKNFDFAITGSGAAGQQIVQSYGGTTDQQANLPKSILDRWHGEGSSNKLPRLTTDARNYSDFSDIYVQDGDYLKIRNISLGYDFAKLINNKNIGQLRLYVSGQNLFTFTKYDGMDPEVGYGNDGGSQDRYSSGIDLGMYPNPQVYLVGVNVKF